MFKKFKKVRAIKKAINHTELSIVERSSIVNEVTEKCFINNEYHAEYVKPMFTLSVLRMFTTISPIMIKNEDGTDNEYVDVEKTYAYCVENHIMDYVVDKCKYMYIDDLFSEVCESIEFKKSVVIASTTSLSDQIITSVVDVINEVKTMVSKNQEVFGFINDVKTAESGGLNIIDAVAKQVGEKVASAQKDDKNVQNVLENEQKDVK